MPSEKKAKRPAEQSPVERARARMYHDLIFECAEKVFAEQGFDECTMQDVAAAAGISLKTLYSTFPGKNDIYADIQRVRGMAFVEAVQKGAGQGSALEQLEGGARAFVSFLLEHDSFRRILLREGRTWGLDQGTEEARRAWRAGIGHVAGVVRQGIEEGAFHDSDDPELLAGSVQAVLQVQLAGRVDGAKGEPDADAISSAILVLLRRMLCCDPEASGVERSGGAPA